MRLPETLRYITMRLRREPDGCPWDRQQTHATLTHYVIEEAQEVLEAIEENDMEKLSDGSATCCFRSTCIPKWRGRQGEFSIGDVFEHVNAKLIRRHPHVFGSVEVENAQQVNQNWDAIKGRSASTPEKMCRRRARWTV